MYYQYQIDKMNALIGDLRFLQYEDQSIELIEHHEQVEMVQSFQ